MTGDLVQPPETSASIFPIFIFILVLVLSVVREDKYLRDMYLVLSRSMRYCRIGHY